MDEDKPLADLAGALSIRPTPTPTIDETPWGMIPDIMDEDWSMNNLFRWAGRETVDVDPDFVKTEDMYRSAIEQGVRIDMLEELDETTSLEDWNARIAHIQQEQEFEQELSQCGWKGTALRFGVNAMDPAAWGIALASGGLGLYGKAAHLAKIAGAGRASRALGVGTYTAAEVAALEAAVASDKITWKTEDAFGSVATSALIGGGLGAAFTRPLKNAADESAKASTLKLAEEGGVPLSAKTKKKLQPASATVKQQSFDDVAPTVMSHIRLPLTNIRIPIRFDMMNAVYTSPSKVLRNNFFNLAQNVLVDIKAGSPAAKSATETMMVWMRRQHTDVQGAMHMNYKAFARDKGINLGKELKGISTKEVFSELIERAVRREGYDYIKGLKLSNGQKTALINATKAYRTKMREVLQELKDAGVKGADDIVVNNTYVPRRIKHTQLQAWQRMLGGGEKGREKLIDILTGAYRGLAKDEARTLLRMWLIGIQRAEQGMFANFGQLSRANIDEFKRYLDQNVTGVSKKKQKELLSAAEAILNKKSKKGDSLSRRIDLDETFEFNLKGQKFVLEDAFESNAFNGMERYLRQMAGKVSAARVMGIRSEDDFRARLQEVEADIADNIAVGDQPRVRRDLARIDVMWRHLNGRPLREFDEKVGWKNTGYRLLMDYNYIRVMNQVGFAQLAEFGNIGALISWRAMFRQMPALRALHRDLKSGKVNDSEIIKDIEALNGVGGEWVRYSTQSERYTGASGEILGVQQVSKAENKALDLSAKAKRVTSVASGMTPITIFSQRWAASAGIQRLMDVADKVPSPKDLIRSREMGWSDDTYAAIRGQLKKNASVDKKGRVITLNLEKWDTALREEFADGIARITYRAIQENDIGALSHFMTSPVGKILTQFRTFMLVAHAKQFLHMLYRRDTDVASAFLITSFMGGMSYMTQSYLRSLGMDDDNEYLFDDDDGALTLKNIAKASFQRSAYSALVPGLIDTVMQHTSVGPIFSHGRSTGLATGFLKGIPSLDTLDKMGKILDIPKEILMEDDPNFRDTLKVLPFQNMFGIINLLNQLD